MGNNDEPEIEQPADPAELIKTYLAGLEGTLTIEKKQNGVMLHVFMPFSEKPKKVKTKEITVSLQGTQLAVSLYDIIQNANPSIVMPRMTDSWGVEMDKLLKKYDLEVITTTVQFAFNNEKDDFWKHRILSAKKFREKFETIAAQATGNSTQGYL